MDETELQALLLATFAVQAVAITDELHQLLGDLSSGVRSITDEDAWSQARRHAHTVKGAGRAVGLGEIEHEAHQLELRLDRFEQDASQATKQDAAQAVVALGGLRDLIDGCVSDSAPAGDVQAPIAGDGGRGRLLVVDDSRTIRDKHLMSLSAAGYDVVLAEDGEEAWQLLLDGATAPLAVISDVEMPRLDGLGLTRRIRSHADFGQLPIVMVTTLESDQHRQAGMEAGADHYLPKSAVGSQRLLDLIEALV